MARPSIHILQFNRMVYDLRNLKGRDLVIVGASLIELGLEISLARSWGLNSKAQHEELFTGPTAVASTFAAKITLARVGGLITRRTADEITHVRKLRNLFAHSYSIDGFSDPSCAKLIDKFGYMSLPDVQQVEDSSRGPVTYVSRPGVTIEPFGYSIAVDDLDMVVDRHGTIGFFVPTIGDNPDVEQRVRQQIWECTLASVVTKLSDWTNDPELMDVPIDFGSNSR